MFEGETRTQQFSVIDSRLSEIVFLAFAERYILQGKSLGTAALEWYPHLIHCNYSVADKVSLQKESLLPF